MFSLIELINRVQDAKYRSSDLPLAAPALNNSGEKNKDIKNQFHAVERAIAGDLIINAFMLNRHCN